MVDRQSSAPEPLSLTVFAASLYQAERADNFFKFLKNFSEEDLAHFLRGLLRQVSDAIDDGSMEALARFVEQGQVAAYAPIQTPTPFRPDFPDAPFAPLRKPLREATVALFSSAAVYLDDQDPYYPAELTYEQAVREVRKATERNYSYHGLTNIPRLVQESAPSWAQLLREDGVDAIFLTAG